MWYHDIFDIVRMRGRSTQVVVCVTPLPISPISAPWVYLLVNKLSHTTEINLAADEFLSDNPHRGGYHGMHVPGT